MSAEFREAAIAAVLKRGSLVSEEDKSWYWGWQEWDLEHAQLQRDGGCKWGMTTESGLKETSFYEFDGTDNESQHSNILGVTHVSCTCGKYSDRMVAIQGTTGDLLGMLLDVGEIKKEYK
jgi:hypothetical protein